LNDKENFIEQKLRQVQEVLDPRYKIKINYNEYSFLPQQKR